MRTRLQIAAIALLAAAASAQGTTGLSGDKSVLCLNTGGTLNLSLDAGSANAGNIYLVVGSSSGTMPGTTLGNGLLLPLNLPDIYFDFTLGQANSVLFPNTFNVLDGSGKGNAGVFAPTGLSPNLAGFQLSYAYFVFQLLPNSIKIAFTSNAVSITLELPPVANFTAAPTSVVVGQNVNFTNTTSGATSSFLWNFGDGTTSTQTNPSKSYASSGSFNVSLTATGPCGSNTVTKTNLVNVARTFTEVYSIFQAGNQCISCHNGTFPAGNLDYGTKAAAFSGMVNQTAACSPAKTLVVPGNAAASFLIEKVKTCPAAPSCGGIMPPNGLCFSGAQIATLESWINSGAPNN